MRTRFQAVNECHQRGDTARVGQPGHGRHLDRAGETRQRRDAAWRHMGTGQLDAQAAHGLNAVQRQDERRRADPHRAFAQSIHPGLTAAFGGFEQFVQASPLRLRYVAPEQLP